MKCKYCGCSNAEYYDKFINTHYCHKCSQIARSEWLAQLNDIVDYIDRIEAKEGNS